jgi:hypothetical protein
MLNNTIMKIVIIRIKEDFNWNCFKKRKHKEMDLVLCDEKVGRKNLVPDNLLVFLGAK